MKTITKAIFLCLLVSSGLVKAQEYFGTSTFGDGSIETSYNSVANSQGVVYTPGLYSGTLNVGSESVTWAGGNADGYVALHDDEGTPLGVLGFGGAFDDVVTDVAIDANDNVYLTGYFQGAVASNPFDADPGPDVFPLLQPAFGLSRDLFIIKLDSNNEFVWAKQVSNPFGFGAINEDGRTIEVDSDGNVYIGGSFLFADFDPDPAVDNVLFSADSSTKDGFILKLDTDGNFVWVKTLPGAGGLVEVEDIEFDDNGDLVILGRLENVVDMDPDESNTDEYNSVGGNDLFMAKYDADGNYIWGQGFGGPGLEVGNVIRAIGSEIYVGGMYSAGADLDPSAGEEIPTPNGGALDSFFTQFDSDGNFQYTYTFGGDDDTALENVFYIAEGPNGDLFVSGSFNGTTDFDAGTGEATTTSNGGTDNFMMQVATDGSYKNHWAIGGTGTEGNPHAIFNDQDQIITSGIFQNDVDFDPFSGEDIQSSNGNRDIYISRFFPFNTGNDSCNGAIPLTCGETVTGETTFDTDSGGNIAPDEFFSFTGTGDPQIVTISLCDGGTDYDSLLRVFDSCDLTNELAVNDDACGVQSEVSFLSDGTSTYFIMVEGFSDNTGNFSLNVSCITPPENDQCEGALPIACGETITGSTENAYIDSDAPECSTAITAPGVWYAFTDDSGLASDYTVSLCDGSTDFDSKLTVYTGECGMLVCETDNDDACGLQSEVTFSGDGNTTYYILVHGFGSATGNFSLNIDCAPVPPPNDMIVNSIDVDELGFPYTDPAVAMPAATTEDGSPLNCNIDGANGVWYNFTSAGDGDATAAIVSPAGASSVTFYEAPDENATETDLVLVDQNTNQCVPGTTATINTTAGQAYYVFVVNTGGITDITIDGNFLDTEDNQLESFTFYPNPTDAILNLKANESIEAISIINMLGQTVLQQKIGNTQSSVDVSALATGSYLLQVKANGNTGTYRLMIQ
ncbi:T9SS type A sorting domain-containing protein [Flavobacteriaceae bacterium TK19130]|nr:T9SS type A sorting domain-containing protein [Thermobacterium salinum]